MLKIAIQKSGRLYDESISLLNQCGLSIENTRGQLKAKVRNFDAEVLFLRNSDIPKYVESGVADVAIVGDNVVYEKEADILSKVCLGFSKCRLSIATPKDFDYRTIQDLEGRRIATSYPNTLRGFLEKHQVKAEIHLISGSVEIAPNIGLADAICDLVSSGSTLFKNNLVEQEIILESQAGLYVNKESFQNQSELMRQLIFRVKAVLEAKNSQYILFNIPNDKIKEASALLPGLKSPTVVPLLEEGWSSMHSVIKKDRFWEIINQLQSAGAEGILISTLAKMVL